MSNAIQRIIQMGRVHPTIEALARDIMSAGWRVTSIWRPTGTHAKGTALDCAPMVFTLGGFGLKTAKLLWCFAKERYPEHNWISNAEADHIHLGFFSYDTLGMNIKGKGTVLYPVD